MWLRFIHFNQHGATTKLALAGANVQRSALKVPKKFLIMLLSILFQFMIFYKYAIKEYQIYTFALIRR